MHKYKHLILILIQSISLLLTSCGLSGPIAIRQTSTPDQFKLANSEFDVCQLFNLKEIDTELEIDVQSEIDSFAGASICRYFSSKDNKNVLLILIYTDATLQKEKKILTATQHFDAEMKMNIKMSQQYGNLLIQDIPDIGDQAYYVEGLTFMEFHFLKGDIEYAILAPSERHISFEKFQKIAIWVSKKIP